MKTIKQFDLFTENFYQAHRAIEEFKNNTPVESYDALRDLLYSPSISFIEESGDTYVENGTGGRYLKDVVLIISLPLYETDKSNVDVRVMKQKDNLGPDILLNTSEWSSTYPYKIVQIRDADTNTITQMKYYFKPQEKLRGKQDYYWSAKARLFTADQRRIPSIAPNTPHKDIDESDHVSETPGWVFADLSV